MKDRTNDFPTFRAGTRVELHPATDLWMRGARFGTVTGMRTAPRECIDRQTGERYLCKLVHVRLDKLPNIVKVHPDNILQTLD